MDQLRLMRCATRDHGVLLPDVLDREGVSAKQRRHRVQTGEWRRLPCGMLVIAGVPETFEMLATAALAAVSGSVLGHHSAGRVHGVEVDDRVVHVCVPPGSTGRCRGVAVHRSALDAIDVTRRRGFPVTTLERTLVDLGATLPPRQLSSVVESALRDRLTTFDRVERVFARVSRQGRPGTKRMRDVLVRLDGTPPTESELEAMFLDLIVGAGLAIPQSQVTFDWAPGEAGRVDFWYEAARLVVELDGRRFHARLEAFERDRRRDQLALMNDQRPVRFTHHQISDSPDEVVEVVRSLLAKP